MSYQNTPAGSRNQTPVLIQVCPLSLEAGDRIRAAVRGMKRVGLAASRWAEMVHAAAQRQAGIRLNGRRDPDTRGTCALPAVVPGRSRPIRIGVQLFELAEWMIRMSRGTAAGRTGNSYGLIIEKNAVPAPGAAHRPQGEGGEVGRPADRCPGFAISGIDIPGLPLTAKINQKLAVWREIALFGIKASVKPLPALKSVVLRVPQRNAPPFRRSAPEDNAGGGFACQENTHPTAIVEERGQVFDLFGHGPAPQTNYIISAACPWAASC